MAAYRSLLATISDPAAVFRLRAVRGAYRIQLLLNALILWRRLCFGLYGGLVILGFAVNKLFFVGVPLILLVNLIGVNPLHTRANVNLSARLAVLDRLMDEDDEFRKQVLGKD